MDKTPKMQAYMDLAYARWQVPGNPWDMQDFLDQLSAAERVAVFAGNLDGQVCNGGFEQWHDNGYATPETLGFLMRLCKRLNTEAASAVDDLLLRFERVQPQSILNYDDFSAECDRLDGTFYTINEAFLADVETSL